MTSTSAPRPLDPDSPKGKAAEVGLAAIIVASRERRAREAAAAAAAAAAVHTVDTVPAVSA